MYVTKMLSTAVIFIEHCKIVKHIKVPVAFWFVKRVEVPH